MRRSHGGQNNFKISILNFGPWGPYIYIKKQKSKFSARATKNYENKCRLHEISRRIDWEGPWGTKIGSKSVSLILGPGAPDPKTRRRGPLKGVAEVPGRKPRQSARSKNGFCSCFFMFFHAFHKFSMLLISFSVLLDLFIIVY